MFVVCQPEVKCGEFFLKTILTPFRGIEGHPSVSSVVAAGAASFG